MRPLQLQMGGGVGEAWGLEISAEPGLMRLQDVGGPPRELRPRLCHLRKGPQGYGFNLHSDKSRPGQYIRSVDPGSPAAHSGLRAQDRLIEVPVVEALGCWGPHERCVSGPVSLHVCVWLVCPGCVWAARSLLGRDAGNLSWHSSSCHGW